MKVDVQNLLVDDIWYSKAVNTYTIYFDDIVESIASNGMLMKPIVVKEGPITYRLEDGHLRIEALKKLGIHDVVAIVIIPEENEKKEDVKKIVDDVKLADYDNIKLNKILPPYYIDQQKILINMIDSFDKIQKDLKLLNEQIAQNEIQLLLNSDEKISLKNVNDIVDDIQIKVQDLNQFIQQEISYFNVRYNVENLSLKGIEDNNLVFNKIKFSNEYLNQTFVSSTQIADFIGNNNNLVNVLRSDGVLSAYISQVSSDVYRTNYALLSPKTDYGQLNSLSNKLIIDNKLFRLKNINSFINKYMSLSNENQFTSSVLKPDIYSKAKTNQKVNLFNFEYKRNDGIFSKQAAKDVHTFIKNIFSPIARKPEKIHIRPNILDEIQIPQQIISLIPRKPKKIHVRPELLNVLDVPQQAVNTIFKKPERHNDRPELLNVLDVPQQAVNAIFKKPERNNNRSELLNIMENLQQTINFTPRKPERIHVRPELLNTIDVPQQAVNDIPRKPERIHVRPELLNTIDVPQQAINDIPRKPERIHVRPNLLNSLDVPVKSENSQNPVITRALKNTLLQNR